MTKNKTNKGMTKYKTNILNNDILWKLYAFKKFIIFIVNFTVYGVYNIVKIEL